MSKTIQNYSKYYREIPKNLFPNEWVVRIFMSNFPKLSIKNNLKGKSILDVSCGDGRNLSPLLVKQMNVYATEVSDSIVKKLKETYPSVKFSRGTNNNLPFENESFDYLLSWNSMYYMGNKVNNINFQKYVKEFARVLKKKGKLIACVPMKSNFIYKNAIELKDNSNFVFIKNDPFEVRNGEIMRRFKNKSEIKKEFQIYFKNFIFGASKNDHFGINNDWFVFYCEKI